MPPCRQALGLLLASLIGGACLCGREIEGFGDGGQDGGPMLDSGPDAGDAGEDAGMDAGIDSGTLPDAGPLGCSDDPCTYFVCPPLTHCNANDNFACECGGDPDLNIPGSVCDGGACSDAGVCIPAPVCTSDGGDLVIEMPTAAAQDFHLTCGKPFTFLIVAGCGTGGLYHWKNVGARMLPDGVLLGTGGNGAVFGVLAGTLTTCCPFGIEVEVSDLNGAATATASFNFVPSP